MDLDGGVIGEPGAPVCPRCRTARFVVHSHPESANWTCVYCLALLEAEWLRREIERVLAEAEQAKGGEAA